MNTEKVKAFAAHILAECEQEGFTIEEVSRLPQHLRFAVDDWLEKHRGETKFIVRQESKKISDEDGHIRPGTL